MTPAGGRCSGADDRMEPVPGPGSGTDQIRMKTPVFIDLRNVYDPAKMKAAGFHYSGWAGIDNTK